jgi:hypothetical protein
LVIQLDESELARAGLEIEAAEASDFAPEVVAYGRVLDPAPASEALANLTSARAAFETSRRELARVEGLARDRENASAREVEVARAAAARARADRDLAEYRVDAVLGAARSEIGDPVELGRCLGQRRAALVRIDVPGGDGPPDPAHGAHLAAYPETGEALDARFLGAAPDIDPQLPGWSFLFLVTDRGPPPGTLVRARLAARGAVVSGVRVPGGAVLRSEGRLYVFVSRGGGRFERREVGARLLDDGTAFISDGVAAGEPLVVAGAQELLSAQRLAAAGGGDEG